MQKFVPFIQIIIASWFADLLGWIGAPLAVAGIKLTYDTNSANYLAEVVTGLLLIAAQRLISWFNCKISHSSTPPAQNVDVIKNPLPPKA